MPTGLYVDGTVPHAVDLNGVGFRVRAVSQNMTASSGTFTFNTVDEDTDAAYSTSTGIYTVKSPGLWWFWNYLTWSLNGSTNVALQSGLTGPGFYVGSPPGSASTWANLATLGALIRCAVGDQIYTQYSFVGSGGPALPGTTGGPCRFAGALIAR